MVRGYCKTADCIDIPEKLEETGILASRKVGREKISVHTALLKLLREPYHVSKNLMYFDTF
ncbi:hypothetical protein ASZ90_014603 [hydrocarbon metagenome]|uniref:Uncharacterized protein n=1 Tax=hydrocarbon metagenome TaxID=938273 RepID=A0A0W8F4A7_9ZZZZ